MECEKLINEFRRHATTNSQKKQSVYTPEKAKQQQALATVKVGWIAKREEQVQRKMSPRGK